MNAAFLSGVLALGLSSFASSANAAILISVDKSAQTLTITRDGETLHIWPVSTGKTAYATPSGRFTTFRMEADHYSKEWDDAPMPHSVFFTKQGHAIHGSYDLKRLGSPASHGCVRLAPENAAKLFALVKAEGLPNTQVVLTGSEQIALERARAQRTASNPARSPDRQPSTSTRTDELRTRDVRLPRPPSMQTIPDDDYAQPRYAEPRYDEPPRYGYSTEAYERPRPRPYYSFEEGYRRPGRHYVDPYERPGYAPYDGRGLFLNR